MLCSFAISSTYLQLLIAALRDFAAEAGSEHLSKLKRLTVNEDEKEGSEGSFKVWPTNADRATFREVLTSGSPSTAVIGRIVLTLLGSLGAALLIALLDRVFLSPLEGPDDHSPHPAIQRRKWGKELT